MVANDCTYLSAGPCVILYMLIGSSLKAQMELLHISTSEHSVVPYSAYVSLIKAFWILMDVITCHPQLPFHTAGSQAEIRVLSTVSEHVLPLCSG